MRSIVLHPLVGLAARIVVGSIFVMYALDKISAPADFALNIERYEILPLAWVNLFALILPWVELIVGIFLLFGVRLRASASVAAVLLVVFIVAIGSAMARGLQIDCGCSAHSEPVGWGKIVEDMLYLLLALRITYWPNPEWTVETLSRAEIPTAAMQ
ncbi:MAG: MauE/DoxX family redox-associated membrane protein [Bacteroidota bacterium]|nr:DoxX family membrane protein [Candidatus Kapabacteria bacterium]MCS7303400.1 DoxX family membrane protein [Candidatus Kapabacteria bacterium]MCX7937414.1 DoxX family membrane protein [Chlorobiota bacterium]MDW8075658.1 MauE/DoxX family redox-associated membrane protein [Bacteroidota bacterium]MDW8272285.1 MauE/DoxX family redox-associated membrane protein [Bacteroidota bacterium]